MLDIKIIRENADKVNELLKRRNPELSIDEVIDIDKQRREVQAKADDLRNQRKTLSQEVGNLKRSGQNADELQDKVRGIGEEIKQLEVLEAELNETQRSILLNIPNMPAEETPIGLSEAENVVVKTVGEVPQPSFRIKPHWEIGLDLGIIDFERGVKISESRFTIYKGAGARLERAIINFFLDLHTREHGYTEILPPFMVIQATQELFQRFL